MYTEEHLFSIALRECSHIGDINFHKLIRAFGSAQNTWKTSSKELQKITGIGKKVISDIGNEKHLKFAEKEITFCQNNNIQINLRHLDQLPFLLKECEDAPAILYQKGKINTELHPLSIVGTRKITSYGKNFIETFFENTKKHKFISVSGLAAGTDKEVHTESIRQKIPTIAVLAHGFHTLYPSAHKTLSEKILSENGALFTEFNSSRKPDRENFIQRNRIIAGISSSTLVVETAFGGGSISTATFANNYNRDVFALPGKITDKFSQGCNHLIFQNKAIAISTVKDLIDQIGFNSPKEKTEELFPHAEKSIQLSENQEPIYNLITYHPQISLDDLAEKTAQPTHKILTIILELELLGKVKSLSGRQFVSI
ncbi:DNA-processing protein DprA [Chryseobacterium camelliae]|uniref:DNA-processing protein DprA n=1 Tax=Chryseobacterium camelliae TaxID=1265445 RepID=A0ABY7QL02_9FLAO|nr:DNA-processing protein DprA [Chryseobacterium camelliae]WBV59396.1 DNA-processing protein DprA [Chryseobacterium camelliae]